MLQIIIYSINERKLMIIKIFRISTGIKKFLKVDLILLNSLSKVVRMMFFHLRDVVSRFFNKPNPMMLISIEIFPNSPVLFWKLIDISGSNVLFRTLCLITTSYFYSSYYFLYCKTENYPCQNTRAVFHQLQYG